MPQELELPLPSTSASSAAGPSRGNAARFLPVLLILFAGSGCSALIYEIVWYQMLQLAIGSTAVSLGMLLATFMGGLCLGSIGCRACALCAGASAADLRCARSWASASSACWCCACIPLIERVYIAGVRRRTAGHAAARLAVPRFACCRRRC